MERVTSMQSYPCVFCTALTQKGITHTPPGPFVAVCVACLKGVRNVARHSEEYAHNLEVDSVICECRYAVDNDSVCCPNPAAYALFHEGYESSDRYAFCCNDAQHLKILSQGYTDAATRLVYVDAPYTAPITDLREGQDRMSLPSAGGLVPHIHIRKMRDLVLVHVIATGKIMWMKPETVVEAWPTITRERS